MYPPTAPPHHPTQKGFTLLELLVVMVILGVLMAAVSINLAPQYSRKVDLEVERLTQLFIFADEMAKLRRENLRWQAEIPAPPSPYTGYQFSYYSAIEANQGNDPWIPFGSTQLPSLSPQKFGLTVLEVVLDSEQEKQRKRLEAAQTEQTRPKKRYLEIDFSREEVNAPFTLRLRFGEGKDPMWRHIHGDGLGNYKVIYGNNATPSQ